MARSRSGTRNLRGPRKPQRRTDQAQGESAVQTLDPAQRGAVDIPNSITVKELAELLGVNAADVIRELIKSGIFASINQPLDRDTASLVTGELGFEVAEARAPEKVEGNGEAPTPQAAKEVLFEEDDASLLVPRPPIVTVMGHVDHGKTSLLDAMRTTNIAAGERGGITQHIGASEITKNGNTVVFLDTPGHEAFTAMRARGAKVTDIAVLVVAADDGVMPQTLEAIDHAKAAKVPIVVALNKIDKADANPDRVKTELSEHGVVIEEFGGDTPLVPVSARTGEGIDDLIDTIQIVADVQELKANPKRDAVGTVVEAEMDKGRGPVATVLVQTGTLNVGDIVTVGDTYGRVRALENSRGERIKKVGPSLPALVLGLADVPAAGDILRVVGDEKTARASVEERKAGARRTPPVAPRSRTCTARSRRVRPRSCASSSRQTCRARSAPSRTPSTRSRPTRSRSASSTRARATSATTTSTSHRRRTRSWSASTRRSTRRRAASAEAVRRRYPPLRHHLQAHRRDERGAARPARARRDRSGRGPRGGSPDLPQRPQRHRRHVRHRRPHHPRWRSRLPWRRADRDGSDRVTAALPRRCPRSRWPATSAVSASPTSTRLRKATSSSASASRWSPASRLRDPGGVESVSERTRRLDELLREEISAVIRREVDDPRIGFVTITDVDVTPDLRHANVWVSIIGAAG